MLIKLFIIKELKLSDIFKQSCCIDLSYYNIVYFQSACIFINKKIIKSVKLLN